MKCKRMLLYNYIGESLPSTEIVIHNTYCTCNILITFSGQILSPCRFQCCCTTSVVFSQLQEQMKTLVVTDISLVAVSVVLKPKELILALLYLNLRRIVKTTFGFSIYVLYHFQVILICRHNNSFQLFLRKRMWHNMYHIYILHENHVSQHSNHQTTTYIYTHIKHMCAYVCCNLCKHS